MSLRAARKCTISNRGYWYLCNNTEMSAGETGSWRLFCGENGEETLRDPLIREPYPTNSDSPVSLCGMVLSAWLDDVSYLMLFGFCLNFVVVVFSVEALPKRTLCLAWEAQSGAPAGCLDGPSAVCFCWILQTFCKPSIWWRCLSFALSSGLLQSRLQGMSSNLIMLCHLPSLSVLTSYRLPFIAL